MPTTPPSITTLPAAPDPNNRTTFNSLAYPWSAALPTFGTQVSAVATNVKANADEAEADAVATAADRVVTTADRVVTTADRVAAEASAATATTGASTATTQAGIATTKAGEANASAIAAAAIVASIAGGPVASVNGMTGVVTGLQAALVSGTSIKTLNGSSLLGSGDLVVGGVASLARSARTSNTILGAADKGTLIDITSGTFTQTFDAVATLTSGWWCYIRNSGTGDITLDPNSTETIDGLTSFVMYPGEVRLVQCDGSALRSIVINAFARTFTSSGTFTTPPGYQKFGALVWSGGASGGKGAAAGAANNGGAGGGCFPFDLVASTFGATETITIGAGGASVTANATNGSVGGNSSIGALAVVYAGNTAIRGGSALSGALGVGTGATNFEGGNPGNTPAQSFYGGSVPSANGSAASAGSLYGGAAGGSHDGVNLRAAGTSVYGGSGGAASVTGNATAGTAPGGGGGMGLNSVGDSGAGARGEVRIWGVM